jgi:hypothetical protein
LKALAIERHPSLAQGAPATRGSKPGLNAHDPHHLGPLRIPTNPVRIPIPSASLPHRRNPPGFSEYIVWPGIPCNAGVPALSATGFALKKGEPKTITPPTSDPSEVASGAEPIAPKTSRASSPASQVIAAPEKSSAQGIAARCQQPWPSSCSTALVGSTSSLSAWSTGTTSL